MEKQHSEILRTNRPVLVKMPNIHDVVDELQSTTPVILTSDMAARIMAKPTPYDKTRELLDTITYRGPNAFDALYKALCKTCNGPAADLLRPERAEQRKREDSTRQPLPNPISNWPTDDDIQDYYIKKNITLKEIFEKAKVKHNQRTMEKYSDNQVYPLSLDDKGIGIIIKNGGPNFDVDVTSVQECFKILGFNSENPLKDCSKEDLERRLKAIISKVKTTSKSIVVFVIAYGNSDGFFCKDDKLMQFSELQTIVNCTNLDAKPKLFVVQTLTKGISEQEKICSDSGSDVMKPKGCDNILFHSWITDNFLNNSQSNGCCFFVQAFVHTAIHSCLTDDIHSIMRKVKRYVDKVKEECNSDSCDNKIESGYYTGGDHALTKKFYFFPYEL